MESAGHARGGRIDQIYRRTETTQWHSKAKCPQASSFISCHTWTCWSFLSALGVDTLCQHNQGRIFHQTSHRRGRIIGIDRRCTAKTKWDDGSMPVAIHIFSRSQTGDEGFADMGHGLLVLFVQTLEVSNDRDSCLNMPKKSPKRV